MSNMSSYPKVWNIGHREVATIFDSPQILIQEKIDGSQFSFRRDHDGTIYIRSKGADIFHPCTDKLFRMAVETVMSLAWQLTAGWTYRAEAVTHPKHNHLAYERIPKGGLILFDIMGLRDEEYLSPYVVIGEANRLGLEVVDTFDERSFTSAEELKTYCTRMSALGGVIIEGVVIKNYNRFGADGKPLFAKYVRPEFKENQRVEWKQSKDIVTSIKDAYRSTVRWDKAVQHLREAGGLDSSPKDIGYLIREVQRDFEEECVDEVKELLWNHYKKDLTRSVAHGLPEWYKETLLQAQFQPSTEE